MDSLFRSSLRRRFAPLLACAPFLLGVPGAARAQSLGLAENPSDAGRFTSRPFVFTIDTRVGYDDNTLDQPDSFKVPIGINANGSTRFRTEHPSESFFLNADASVAYTAKNSRSSLTLGATAGITYYFDRPGRDYDPNIGLNVRYTYKLTPRAGLEVSSFSVYQAEPDFGTVGLQERRNGDYFYTANRFALSYRWAPRFSTVSSYDPVFVIYRQDPFSFYQDRAEHYFSQEFRFLVQPKLTLVGEYRFGFVQYFNSRDAGVGLFSPGNGAAPVAAFVPDFHSDSYSHFVLAGIDYSLGPRLQVGLRVGAQFRTYDDDTTFVVTNRAGDAFPIDRNTNVTPLGPTSRIVGVSRGTETSPYVEGTLTYSLSRRANIALVTRYGIEEGNLALSDSSRDSFRGGLTYNQGFTARLSGYLGFYYTHNDYNAAGDFNGFSENVYDVALGVRFNINRHIALEAGYTHTTVDSDSTSGDLLSSGSFNNFSDRGYDRNRYFVGARFAF